MEKKKADILAKIKAAVQEINSEAEVILFGSRARGNEQTHSDWDILILTPSSVGIKGEQVFRHKLFDLELEFGEAFSTYVISKSDWNKKYKATQFYQQILKEGLRI